MLKAKTELFTLYKSNPVQMGYTETIICKISITMCIIIIHGASRNTVYKTEAISGSPMLVEPALHIYLHWELTICVNNRSWLGVLGNISRS